MIRRLRSLLCNRRGTATIELALIGPVLATMLVGVVDITTAFNRKLELEQGVQRAIERVMQTTTEFTVEDNIKAEVASATGISTENVTVVYFLSCDGTSMSASLNCGATQAEVRYTIVSAVDTFTPMLPLAAIGFGGPLTLSVETEMRTQ